MSAGRARRRSFLGAALGAALIGCATPGPAPPAPGSLGEQSLVHAGQTRTFLVHDYSGDRPAPMVLVLHGGGGNAANAVQMTGFDEVARRERLVVVYPEGSSRPVTPNVRTWNAGHCCAYAMQSRIDDVGFFAALIDRMVASGAVDRDRVYVTGISNGAMMSHRLGIELSDRIAGIAPVVGAIFGDETAPKGPVAAVIVTGAIDRTVPGEGGPIGRPGMAAFGSADRDVQPARAQAEFWAKANGCRSVSTRSAGASTLTVHTGCASGAEVRHYVVDNNGHAWPGGRAGRAEADQPTPAFNASQVIWEFFRDKRLKR